MRDYVWCKGKLGCENFWLKIPWVPPLKYLRNVSPPSPQKRKLSEMLGLWIWVGPEYPYPPPPPPQHENLAKLRDFGFELVQSTPPPHPTKVKTWPDWGTLDLSWPVCGDLLLYPPKIESTVSFSMCCLTQIIHEWSTCFHLHVWGSGM